MSKCACGHERADHATDGCVYGWYYGDQGGLFGGCQCPVEGVGDFRDMVP